MLKNSAAFTLIELMVVVAIIAILSTMGVANFSTAIKRSRNAVRQNDVIAVSKALETCYDVMEARYLKDKDGKPCILSGTKEYTSSSGGGSSTSTDGVFVADVRGNQDCQNRCLNANIVPSIRDHDYTAVVGVVGGVEKYVVCAKLERVGNWEGIGNSETNLAAAGSTIEAAMDGLANPTKCTPTGTECYFCVGAQQ